MLFLRISGSILLLISAAFAARFMNKRAESELSEFESILRLIRQIKLEVESFSMPIPRILEKIDKRLLFECGYQGEGAPQNLSELYSGISFKSERSKELFHRFSGDFGSGYREEELRRLAYYIELFENERKKLAEELPAKKKINLTLSVSAALGIVILMI